MNTRNSHRIGVMLVAGAALGWSALGSLILLLPATISPLAISAVRGFWIASAFLFMSIRSGNRLPFSWPIVWAGLAYGLSALAYIASLRLLPVAMAAPLHYTTPAFLIIGSTIFSSRRPSRNDLYGVVSSLIGSVVLVLTGDLTSWCGVLYAILSAILWALYLALQGRLCRNGKNSAAVVGGLCLLLVGFGDLHSAAWSTSTWGILLMIGVFSSILPLLLLARASSVVAPTAASLILLLEPVLATILAILINGQFPAISKIAGMIFVVTGAMFGLGVLGWRSRPAVVPSSS